MIAGRRTRMNRDVAAASFVAVALPPPRQFTVNDLVTIIIRESVEAHSRSQLETEKTVNFKGQISDFPNLRAQDLMNLQLGPSRFSRGRPKLGVEFDSDFEGEGQRRRHDTFITRISARIIDIKPNGNLVLEGRKSIKTDTESSRLLITGTCRPQDVNADNTILSTHLYDLNVTSDHAGHLRQAAAKGWLTRLLDTVFHF